MDLTEAEYIKKRWQEYTQGLYKKTNKQKNQKKKNKKQIFTTLIIMMVWSLT